MISVSHGNGATTISGSTAAYFVASDGSPCLLPIINGSAGPRGYGLFPLGLFRLDLFQPVVTAYSRRPMEAAEYELMDNVEARMWWYRALHARLLDGLCGVRGRVLDAGCGTGGLLKILRDRCGEMVGVGIEWDQAAAARARDKAGAMVARGSVNVLPFDAGRFDGALSADVLCHRAVDPEAALAELKRVLRPGGRLVLNLPAYGWMMSAHDRRVHNTRRFTAVEVTRLLRQAGFSRVRAHYWNGLLLPLMIVQRKILARGAEVSDVAAFPPLLDATLYTITEFERRLRLPLPAGGSVLAIAEKP